MLEIKGLKDEQRAQLVLPIEHGLNSEGRGYRVTVTADCAGVAQDGPTAAFLPS